MYIQYIYIQYISILYNNPEVDKIGDFQRYSHFSEVMILTFTDSIYSRMIELLIMAIHFM